jgi:hypothetical protein
MGKISTVLSGGWWWSLPRKAAAGASAFCRTFLFRLRIWTDAKSSPILTYGGKGTTKKGLDPTTHAIIYMSDQNPRRLAAETKMTKEPLAVDAASPDQKLDDLSRINFAKIYTVEYNVKIMPVGQVTASSLPYLTSYFRNQFISASSPGSG